MNNQMKTFIKMTDKNDGEVYKILRKHPLRQTIFQECGIRSRRVNDSDNFNGVNQFEFMLSKEEYEKFGLKKTQAGQIVTAINNLIKLNLISKTDRKTKQRYCNIYRLEINDIYAPKYEGFDNSSTDNNQIEDTKEDKKISKNNKLISELEGKNNIILSSLVQNSKDVKDIDGYNDLINNISNKFNINIKDIKKLSEDEFFNSIQDNIKINSELMPILNSLSENIYKLNIKYESKGIN